MKHFFLVPVAMILLAGCGNQQTQVENEVEVPVTAVETVKKPIQEFVVLTGTVAATKDFAVKSETSGFYTLNRNPRTSRPYSLGDRVKKDEVIVKLVNPEQENSIKIESVKINLSLVESEYQTQKTLYDKGGVTLRDLKTAEKNLLDTRLSYENALMQLAKFNITAPFDGELTDINYYTPNTKVASGADIFHIMDYSTLSMDINVPGNLMDVIKVGQGVRVMNYTIPDKIFNARVAQVSPAIDSSTRTFKANLNISNPGLVLRPGMFVKAEIITASKDSALVIPKNIILTRRNSKSIFVVDRGAAAERQITTGLANTDEVEVTSGLEPGERLITTGFETLRNGTRVKLSR